MESDSLCSKSKTLSVLIVLILIRQVRSRYKTGFISPLTNYLDLLTAGEYPAKLVLYRVKEIHNLFCKFDVYRIMKRIIFQV